MYAGTGVLRTPLGMTDIGIIPRSEKSRSLASLLMTNRKRD